MKETGDSIDNPDLLVRLQNVGVRYRSGGSLFHPKIFWGLSDITLDLSRGETLGVLGYNGAGKTTLMRVLAGICAHDTGNVRKRQYRAMLLALQAGFIPHLTGRQNALLGGMLLGVSRRDMLERLHAVVEFAALGEFLDEPIRAYSSGMRARLGLAVALQADPDLLLVDEVLGVGDIEFRQKSTLALRRLIQSNKTVVLATHNLQTVSALCHRVVWLDKGRVVEEGEPSAVIRSYRASRKKWRNGHLSALTAAT